MSLLLYRNERDSFRGSKRPRLDQKRAGFIQASLFRSEIRRAGEQTSPQVARAAGLSRQRDEGGGSDSGSSLIRRFLF